MISPIQEVRNSRALTRDYRDIVVNESQLQTHDHNPEPQENIAFKPTESRASLQQKTNRRNTLNSRFGLGSKSVGAMAKKKDTMWAFRSKLEGLERNKQELEDKMRIFDQRVGKPSKTRSISDYSGRY